MSRIYHSGGDVMLGSTRLTPEMSADLLTVWTAEGLAAVHALDASAYSATASLVNQLTVALIEQNRWMKCTDRRAA